MVDPTVGHTTFLRQSTSPNVSPIPQARLGYTLAARFRSARYRCSRLRGCGQGLGGEVRYHHNLAARVDF